MNHDEEKRYSHAIRLKSILEEELAGICGDANWIAIINSAFEDYSMTITKALRDLLEAEERRDRGACDAPVEHTQCPCDCGRQRVSRAMAAAQSVLGIAEAGEYTMDKREAEEGG